MVNVNFHKYKLFCNVLYNKMSTFYFFCTYIYVTKSDVNNFFFLFFFKLFNTLFNTTHFKVFNK